MLSDVENVKLLRDKSKRLVLGHIRELNSALHRDEVEKACQLRESLENEFDNLYDLHFQVLDFEENDGFIDEVTASYDKALQSYVEVMEQIRVQSELQATERVKIEIVSHLRVLRQMIDGLKESISYCEHKRELELVNKLAVQQARMTELVKVIKAMIDSLMNIEIDKEIQSEVCGIFREAEDADINAEVIIISAQRYPYKWTNTPVSVQSVFLPSISSFSPAKNSSQHDGPEYYKSLSSTEIPHYTPGLPSLSSNVINVQSSRDHVPPSAPSASFSHSMSSSQHVKPNDHTSPSSRISTDIAHKSPGLPSFCLSASYSLQSRLTTPSSLVYDSPIVSLGHTSMNMNTGAYEANLEGLCDACDDPVMGMQEALTDLVILGPVTEENCSGYLNLVDTVCIPPCESGQVQAIKCEAWDPGLQLANKEMVEVDQRQTVDRGKLYRPTDSPMQQHIVDALE